MCDLRSAIIAIEVENAWNCLQSSSDKEAWKFSMVASNNANTLEFLDNQTRQEIGKIR